MNTKMDPLKLVHHIIGLIGADHMGALALEQPPKKVEHSWCRPIKVNKLIRTPSLKTNLFIVLLLVLVYMLTVNLTIQLNWLQLCDCAC